MLKWRFPMEDAERQGRHSLVRRAGIDGQRRSRTDGELQATADAQAGFIRVLLDDRERSLSLLENVMEEFSSLQKQITIAEEEIAVEKETSRELKSELEQWKTECANLKLCANLLQAEMRRLRPSNHARNAHMAPQNRTAGPQQPTRDDTAPAAFSQPINHRGSQNITYQNMLNESLLESQINSRTSDTSPATDHSPATCSVYISNGDRSSAAVVTRCHCSGIETSEQLPNKTESKCKKKGVLKRLFGRLKRCRNS